MTYSEAKHLLLKTFPDKNICISNNEWIDVQMSQSKDMMHISLLPGIHGQQVQQFYGDTLSDIVHKALEAANR